MSIPQAVQRFNTLVEFVQTVMRENVDYGIIPGTPKPTLLKGRRREAHHTLWPDHAL